MSGNKSRFLVSNFLMAILLLFLLGCESSKKDGVSSKAPFVLSFKDNYLSVKVEKIPLGKVLEELGRKANLQIFMDAVIAKETVTIEFKNLLLEEGIRRILQGRNYALTYAQPSVSSSNSASPQGIIGIKVVQSGSAHSDNPSAAIHRRNEEKDQRSLEEMMHEASGSSNPLTRASTLRALGEYAEEAETFKVIVNALRDDDPIVRRVALEVIEETGEQLPIDSIVKVALNDPSPSVRMSALELLVNNNERAAEGALKRALRDPDPRVRNMAEGILKELEGEK
jgi:hypothetical protein